MRDKQGKKNSLMLQDETKTQRSFIPNFKSLKQSRLFKYKTFIHLACIDMTIPGVQNPH
jgi:hypothetical protein